MNNLRMTRRAVSKKQPLIHCITNPISISQCANTILAAGARPIMAEHPAEVQEITSSADALMLNLGNITDIRMQSMKTAVLAANQKGIPVLFDAVGVACSRLRQTYLQELLNAGSFAVIKGNYSEILAISNPSCRSSGVDADRRIDTDTISRTAAGLAQKYRAAILASGKTDVVTDGAALIHVKNGTPQLCSVTGTGCMLGALCSAYLPVSSGINAAAAACTVMGVCGQKAETEKGSGSFMVSLMDALSSITDAELENSRHLEETELESI